MAYKLVGDDYESGYRNCMAVVSGMYMLLGDYLFSILFLSPNFYYYSLIYTPIFICASTFLLVIVDDSDNEVVIEIFI